jgi:hypothetical protein
LEAGSLHSIYRENVTWAIDAVVAAGVTSHDKIDRRQTDNTLTLFQYNQYDGRTTLNLDDVSKHMFPNA